MFDNRIGYVFISDNCWWVNPFLGVVHDFCSIVLRIIFLIGMYHISLFSSNMIIVVVATESWVALELFLISIDVGVVAELTGSLELLVLSIDTSDGSVLFQIQSLSGCASSNFLTLIAG